MGIDIFRGAAAFLKLLIKPNRWKYGSSGYCPSCGSRSVFTYSTDVHKWFTRVMAGWDLSDLFKERLLARENYHCVLCRANFRVRSHADAVLKLTGMSNADQLLVKLADEGHFIIYETAAYNIFRINAFKKRENYIVSEYFTDRTFGSSVNGVRNENLECLTFPDNNFDIVINSDVLEHVGDLQRALSEIKRVLKPGGFHIFTIPVDTDLQRTTERARIEDGKIVHLREPVMHGDSIRGEGILTFRDFGNDVMDCLSIEGLECKEIRYSLVDRYITSVYYAQKHY